MAIRPTQPCTRPRMLSLTATATSNVQTIGYQERRELGGLPEGETS